MVKTYWCENYEKVTQGCPVPVVMAGGPKCKTNREVFEFVHDGMQKGAAGINLGRNVWQNEHPVPMAKALRAIVHKGADVEKAVEIAAQIVEAVHLEAAIDRPQSPRLEVQLDPPELGKVWIELSEVRDGLVAKITVSRAETHQLLEGELAQIRSSLDEAGVQISDFQVGRDDSRFQGESHASRARAWQTEHSSEADGRQEAERQQIPRYGPQGSRIDVRL